MQNAAALAIGRYQRMQADNGSPPSEDECDNDIAALVTAVAAATPNDHRDLCAQIDIVIEVMGLDAHGSQSDAIVHLLLCTTKRYLMCSEH